MNSSRVMDSGTAKTRGRGRLDFAHQFVSELDGRAHEIAVGFFEDSLFLAGFEQCLHIHRSFFLQIWRAVCERRDGIEETHKHRDRCDDPKQEADGP